MRLSCVPPFSTVQFVVTFCHAETLPMEKLLPWTALPGSTSAPGLPSLPPPPASSACCTGDAITSGRPSSAPASAARSMGQGNGTTTQHRNEPSNVHVYVPTSDTSHRAPPVLRMAIIGPAASQQTLQRLRHQEGLVLVRRTASAPSLNPSLQKCARPPAHRAAPRDTSGTRTSVASNGLSVAGHACTMTVGTVASTVAMPGGGSSPPSKQMAPLPAGYSWGSEGSIAAARVTRQSGARPASATSAPRAASIWRPPPPPRLEPWTPPPTTDEGGSGGGGVGVGGRGQHAATSNDSTFGARHAPDKVGLARSDAQRSQLAADRLAERMARQQLEVFERESARSREALSAFLNSRRDRRQVQALHTTIETAEAANLRAASQMLVVDLRTKLAGLVAGTGTIECGRVVRERESRARSREECS